MSKEKFEGRNRDTVPDDLLAILVCPVDHAKVHLDETYLVCEDCGLAYPIRDGIPVMLVEEAEQRKPSRHDLETADSGDSHPEAATGRTPGAAEGAE